MELTNLSNLKATAKIIDAFTFYNELDMLDFRLAELNSVVDYFVLVEATKTHSGNDKELWFENNKSRYSKYLHKIIHIVVDDFPETTDSWVREKFQRIAISRAFSQIKMSPTDIVTITDCDEIPDPNTLLYLKNNFFNGVLSLEQDFYYYNVECRFNYKWYHPKVCTYSKLLQIGTTEQIRFCPCQSIKYGGWHFSYFGSTEIIANKIKNFAHQEFNTSEFTSIENIEDAIKNNRDLFKREGLDLDVIPVETNPYLPKHTNMIMKKSTFLQMRPGNYSKGLHNLIGYVNEISDVKQMNMIEIGSYTGESTEIFAEDFKSVLSIDPYLNDYDPLDLACSYADFEEVYIKFKEVVAKFENIKHIRKTSDDAFDSIDKSVKYDLIYIDGLHTYEQVKKDIANYIQLLKPNGFIAGHDFSFQPVKNAVLEVLGKVDTTFEDDSWIKQIK